MAVRFLLGPAGSGKTHHCLAALRQLEHDGRPGIYLVPEQFTYSADRELLAGDELSGLRHVHVLSFTRFAWWLHEKTATPVPGTIDDAVRPMYLRAVIERMDPAEVGAIAQLKREHGLVQQLSRFVGEVRNHASPGFLHNLAAGRGTGEIPSGVLEKLHALAAVFGAYSARLRENGWRDPEERLAGMIPLIAEQAADLREVSFFVDGFLSWTKREVELLIALGRTGASIEIGLCCDPREHETGDVRVPFGPVWRSHERLVSDFERAEVPLAPPLFLENDSVGRFASPPLRELERQIYGTVESESKPSTSSEAIVLQSAEDRRQEVVCWARQIDRWTRLDPHPTRPGQIAVLLRDIEPYRDLVARIFPRYGISYFLDERRSALSHPQCRLVLHALEVLLAGWRRASVVGLLRNPLLEIDPATVDLIENLSLQYGRDFEAWYAEEWENFIPAPRTRYLRADGSDPDPNLLADPFETEGEDEEEPAIEVDSFEQPAFEVEDTCGLTDQIRQRVLLPLRDLERTWNREQWNGSDVVAQIKQYAIGVLPASSERIEPVRRETGDADGKPSEDTETEWEQRVSTALGDLLSEMADIWSDVPVTIEEFTRTLREGLRALRIGVTPLRHDQVMVGDVQRSRLQGIERSIVGGVNEGVFPRAIRDDPILNERDREALSQLGLPLGPTAVERQEEEAYLFYIALTRASHQLLLTWSGRDESGDPLSPSLLLNDLRAQMPGLVERPSFEEIDLHQDPGAVQARGELTSALLRRLSDVLHARSGRESEGDISPSASPPETETPGPDTADADATLAELPMFALPLFAGKEPEKVAFDDSSGVSEEPASEASAQSLLERHQVWLDIYESLREKTGRFELVLQQDLAQILPGLLFRNERHLPDELRDLCFPGSEIRSSVSRLTEFVSCPYQNFARSILRLEPRPEAKITPLETGSLAHDVLDGFFADLDPVTFDRAGLDTRLTTVFETLRSDPAYRAFQVDPSSAYRWNSTRYALKRFLGIELARLAESSFKIGARELPFGLGEHPPLTLPLPGDGSLVLRGQIDRVDLAPPRAEGERTRAIVIDYKRTRRSGLPRTLEEGLDLQLGAYLLYLDSVKGYEPVGGIYLPVLPSPPRTEKMKDRAANPIDLKAHGLVLASERDEFDAGADVLVRRRGNRGQILPDRESLDRALDTTRVYLSTYAENLRSGWIEPRPLQSDAARIPCDHCDYGSVCRFQQSSGARRHQATEGMIPVRREKDTAQDEAR